MADSRSEELFVFSASSSFSLFEGTFRIVLLLCYCPGHNVTDPMYRTEQSLPPFSLAANQYGTNGFEHTRSDVLILVDDLNSDGEKGQIILDSSG